MKLQILEDRTTPVFLGVRDGIVYMPNFLDDYVPFPDFLAAHAVAGDEHTTVVGAAPGGGPRVQVRQDGQTVADFFAYEESFRDGVDVALSRDYVITGAAPGGGPVVAVFDKYGNEISRFFAYAEDFRGGISVAVFEDTIITVPGPGGGPHVRQFDFHGTPLNDFFGAEPSERTGWNVVVGDVTHDYIPDIVLQNGSIITINEGVTFGKSVNALPPGYTDIGHDGETLTIGGVNSYVRGRALWTSFNTLIDFDIVDSAAGNPSAPPTTGFRPGVYTPRNTNVAPPPSVTESLRTYSELPSSASIGSLYTGTGSSFVPMIAANGQQFAVTASHVVKFNPYMPLTHVNGLTMPGPADATQLNPATLIGNPVSVSTITETQPYVVDAAAFELYEGNTLDPRVKLGTEFVSLDSVTRNVASGDVLITVGRGKFVGVGQVYGYQEELAPITWADGSAPIITGQIIGQRGITRLAVPGFSGGVAMRLSWTPQGVIRELVGMVVAGNDYYTYITPISAIEQELNLAALVK